ncbi:MAG: hypothetical protein WCK09_14665 [Bacteroidota bacterium]
MGKTIRRKQTSIEELPKNEKNLYNPAFLKRIVLFGIPLSGFLVILFIWSELYKPKVIDEWYRGIMLVDSAGKTSDSIAKKGLLDRGGHILKQQATSHPYHARVWFLYGHYFLVCKNWDSCIYAEKKSIELGAGGLVNNVEYQAAEHLNFAVDQKIRGIHNLDSVIKVINNALTTNFENSTLDKIKGFTYYNYNKMDSCSFYLERFNSKVKNDFDVLTFLAFTYSRKGMREKALFYAAEAKKIKSDNANLNNLITQLSNR